MKTEKANLMLAKFNGFGKAWGKDCANDVDVIKGFDYDTNFNSLMNVVCQINKTKVYYDVEEVECTPKVVISKHTIRIRYDVPIGGDVHNINGQPIKVEYKFLTPNSMLKALYKACCEFVEIYNMGYLTKKYKFYIDTELYIGSIVKTNSKKDKATMLTNSGLIHNVPISELNSM